MICHHPQPPLPALQHRGRYRVLFRPTTPETRAAHEGLRAAYEASRFTKRAGAGRSVGVGVER